MISSIEIFHSDVGALARNGRCLKQAGRLASAVVIGASVLFAAGTGPAYAQKAALVIVDVKVVAEGIRVSKLIGIKVTNNKGETIGDIDDIIIVHDKALMAILEVGGFLGLGGYLIAVPYDSLVVTEHGAKISLRGASKEELKKLPEFNYGK